MSSTMDEKNKPNLGHVYFFVKLQGSSTPSNSATSDNDSDMSIMSSTTTSSFLNPLASDFILPRRSESASCMYSTNNQTAAALDESPFFEMRYHASSGYGLYAKANITIGTCIISEPPLLSIPSNELPLVVPAYECLTSREKATFDSLHAYVNDELSLENASRMYLIDPSLKESEIDKQVTHHVRIMSIFNCNDFKLSGSRLGIFPTASRMNHSCAPNVHHSYNPTLGHETVHAIRHIQANEEILTTYMGGAASFQITAERREKLQLMYGFHCMCSACAELPHQPNSDRRRELLALLVWGLNEYSERAPSTNPFIPASDDQALYQAEDVIGIFIVQGLVYIELAKAYRFASMQAVKLGYFDKALEYAHSEVEVERNCLGTVLDDLKKAGTAAQCWVDRVRTCMQQAGKVEHKVQLASRSPQKKQKRSANAHKKRQANRSQTKESLANNVAERQAMKAPQHGGMAVAASF